LNSYKTDSQEVRDFLNSLKNVVVYVVPALIDAFSVKHQEKTAPDTLQKLMSDRSYLNSLFVDSDGLGWSYLGISSNGLPLCRADNSELILELPINTQIKWLF
jgi:hypothetical protein